MHQPKDDDQERTTAIGLANFATEFYDTAIAARSNAPKNSLYQEIAPVPVYYLLAHSIELGLKSYILHHGKDLRRLKKISHNLAGCWAEAVRHGFDKHLRLTESHEITLNLLSEAHAANDFRYLYTGHKLWPLYEPVQILAYEILTTITPVVGYPFWPNRRSRGSA